MPKSSQGGDNLKMHPLFCSADYTQRFHLPKYAGRSLLEDHRRRLRLNRSKPCDPNAASLLRVMTPRFSSTVVAEFTDYAWLIGQEGAAYLAKLAGDARPALRQLESLRRELSAKRTKLVVEQTELRRRARAKFGADSAQMFFTPVHLEQATDRWIGQYKAARFHDSSVQAELAHDYCCGIGGDLLWLSKNGCSIGYDQSDVACLLAAANLRALGREAEVIRADVAELAPTPNEAWHVDPDRRSTGSRTTTVKHYSPGPDLIDRWLAESSHGAIKLAPAAEVPEAWGARAECEWITSQRECRQQVAWFGALATASGQHRATLVSADRHGDGYSVASTFVGAPGRPLAAAQSAHGYLFDPDPSVLAAHLLGALSEHHGLQSLGAGGAYLTGARPLLEPLLQGFIVNDCLPLRTATVAQYFAARGVGRVEIKKRGVTIDPEKFRRQLKLRGDNEATVILTRIGKQEVALICERIPAPPGLNEPPPPS